MKVYVILAVLNTIFISIDAEATSEQAFGEDIGEYGNYFEGDMLLTEEQYEAIEEAQIPHDDNEQNAPKNGIVYRKFRWPNKTVVYFIPSEVNFSKEQLTKIEEAMQDIESKSCVKFRKRKSDKEYAVVFMGRRNGCYSSVGYNGGKGRKTQVLNLANGCFCHGTIVHEMLHTLGFYHMQSTYDRDDYVTIYNENIQGGFANNFAKYTNNSVTDFGVPYDYGSVMHYPRKAFSKNGADTIVPKKEGVMIGQRKGLSKRDIIKLNRMYDCPNETTTTEKETIMDLDFLDNVPVIRP